MREALEHAYVMLDERVLAILGEPSRGFRFGQTRCIELRPVARPGLLLRPWSCDMLASRPRGAYLSVNPCVLCFR